MTQLTLDIPYRKAFAREDFLVTPSHLEAISWIDQFPNWPFHAVLIVGEQGAGKTHLAHVFSKNIIDAKDLTLADIPNLPKSFVLENIEDTADENVLFHLYNYIKENRMHVLMTARYFPTFKLPDLKTRMSAVPIVRIMPPDDDLMLAILCKQFQDRQVEIDGDVLSYLLTHLERSFSAIHALVDEADRLSLSQKRRITVPLVKRALDEVQKQKLL